MPHATTYLLSSLIAAFTPAGLEDPVYSGPQPGEKIAPFNVLQSAGPNAGQEIKLAADDQGAPTLLIFVHEATRPGLQLMRPIDLYGSKLANDGLATHFVWLTPDRSKTEDWLRNARASLNLKSPVNISLDGIEGPGSYGLNRKVTLTILVAKDHKVTANFAIVQPNETDAPKVLAAVASVMGKSAPTMESLLAELGVGARRDMPRPARRGAANDEPSKLSEDPAALIQKLEATINQMMQDKSDKPADLRDVLRLEAQIARLQARDQEHHARALARVADLEKLVGDLVDALNESRTKVAKLEGKPVPEPIKKPTARETAKDEAPTPARGADLPGRTPSDPEIITLMRRMIQPSNDEATVNDIVAAMERWVGDNPQRRDDLVQFAKRIAHLGYGSEVAKRAIARIANGS
jgi:hypothetical protein